MGWCPAQNSCASWADGTIQSWLTILLEMVSNIITTLVSKMSSSLIGNSGLTEAGTSCQALIPSRYPVEEQHRPSRYQKTARTGWSNEINVAVMECYFLSGITDEEGKHLKGYLKRIYYIWEERQTDMV